MSVTTRDDADTDSQRDRRFDGGDADVDSIILPQVDADVPQNVEWCEVAVDGTRERVRFHDYARIFEVPGLYERIFYDILRCNSPERVIGMLEEILAESGYDPGELRVIDVGAGNGIVGEELAALEPDCVVGLDILEAAQQAAQRDRPEVYDDYLVTDLTEMSDVTGELLERAQFNCLTSVATLGFNDIPPEAFAAAADFVATPGWLAFNLKEDFLEAGEQSGFGGFIHRLQQAGIIRIEAYRRYRHRLSVAGEPLHYVALVARKLKDIPARLVEGVRAVDVVTA
ncbi:MAG: methyltransferase [Acidobacteriota bacterium]|jgi:predicted TPR repeat methyltransferase